MNAAYVCAVFISDPAHKADAKAFFAGIKSMVVGVPIEACIVGPSPDERQAQAAALAGASRIWMVSHAQLPADAGADELLAVLLPAIEAVCTPGGGPVLFAFPVDDVCNELTARLAMRLDGTALGCCRRVERGQKTWKVSKRVLAGRVELLLDSTSELAFASVRDDKTGEMPVPDGKTASPDVRCIVLELPLPGREHIRRSAAKVQRKRIEGARVIVSGGRGMKSEVGFAQLEAVAETLDAAVGGSLPAVDAGWLPVSHQVGQSGKYVTPEVYVAVGLSGTPQHLAGIAPYSDIVAINIDAAADIFKAATIGAVADWKELLPALLARLRASA